MTKIEIPIVFENQDILIINKPSGFSVTADRGGSLDIRQILASQLGLDPQTGYEQLRLVHRLDKDTSGILVLARTPEAQSLYSSFFAKRTVAKLYLAIVRGIPSRESGIIRAPIGKFKPSDQTVIVHPRLGKPAESCWRVLAQMGGIALLAVSPTTGRTHQIRIHLKHRSLPLLIDPLYGNAEPLMLSSFKPAYRPKQWEEEQPLIDRLTLHAYQLRLPVGAERTEQVFTASLDKKFATAIKMLIKYAGGSKTADRPPAIDDILNARPLDIHWNLQDESDS